MDGIGQDYLDIHVSDIKSLREEYKGDDLGFRCSVLNMWRKNNDGPKQVQVFCVCKNS